MTVSSPRQTTDSIGDRVRQLRRRRGLTQLALASRAGLAADTIRRLESGDAAPSPRLVTLRALATGFGLTLAGLLALLDDEGDDNDRRELQDLLATRTASERALGLRVLRSLYDHLDGLD